MEFGISVPALMGQLFIGAINGAFYALLSLGLAVIFGLLNIINFAQGDLMMLGMYFAWYAFAGFGVLAFLGPYAGPIVAAILAHRPGAARRAMEQHCDDTAALLRGLLGLPTDEQPGEQPTGQPTASPTTGAETDRSRDDTDIDNTGMTTTVEGS